MCISSNTWIFRRTPSTREVLWPDGRQPHVGELFRQPDLARSCNTSSTRSRLLRPLPAHLYERGVLRVESTIPPETLQHLEELGHRVEVWPPYDWRAGGIGVIAVDEQGMISAGADPRRENYALAW